MFSKHRNIFVVTLLQIISLVYLSSCYNTGARIVFNPNDFVIKETKTYDKIPLRAGIYLREEFKNYIWTPNINVAMKNGIFMGEALSKGCLNILKSIFQEAIVYPPETNKESVNKNIDVIITPDLIDINFYQRIRSDPLIVRTVIKWNIVSPNGTVIYYNTITSEGSNKLTLTFPRDFALEKEEVKVAFVLSIKDQFLKAQEDIHSNGWWKKQWWEKDE